MKYPGICTTYLNKKLNTYFVMNNLFFHKPFET